jgi:hypothetical protein
MVIIHFSPFTTVSVIHSESMPSKLTKTPKEELKPFLTKLGTRMRAKKEKEGKNNEPRTCTQNP